ncbi:hypothetical protein [Halorussus halophilus]|uniref:hypothetical protein n=1 Tax=Halorussus halophilus TaxID=2650975 RepID=UPI0013011FD6|nr:hypothetical protein [Halorussus halophilus]
MEYILIEDNEGSLGFDHYSLLSPAGDGDAELIADVNPELSEDHPFWPQTSGWLFETLSKSGWEHITEATEEVVFSAENPEIRLDEVRVWFDAVCDYVDNGRTDIACVAEINNQRVAT